MEMTFQPDPQQARVLQHERGPLIVTGAAGTGKTAVLRERLARLIEQGGDPERVGLVVRTRRARREARATLLRRLRRPLPGLHVMTVHALAYRVVTARFKELGYDQPPEVLRAVDQFSKVRELLDGEDPGQWREYGAMVRMRGFADQVRQFLLRAQEALLGPEGVRAKAEELRLGGWRDVAGFYRRYLRILDDEGAVDFAGLIEQAAAAAGKGDPLFDHLLVDDYQEATFAAERLLAELNPRSLVVAGDADAHVFSFQGTTDQPLRRYSEIFRGAERVTLATQHRSSGRTLEAWSASHTSEEHAAVARELRRIHMEDGVAWRDLAVVARRQGSHMGGLLRALDDAGVPRVMPERGLSLLAEPATFPLVLALRWASRPSERDGLAEAVLTSDMARLSPATARAMVRAARAQGGPPSAALEQAGGLSDAEAEEVRTLRDVLQAVIAVAERSVLDAFAILWRRLPYARRLVQAGDTAEGRRDLDAVVAFSEAVQAAAARADASTSGFLTLLEGGDEGPGFTGIAGREEADAVRVLTAHGAAGQEFDTAIVVGCVEGNFPSLSRPEPMFDLDVLDRAVSQSERNRRRLEDERRLFKMVVGRTRRRVLFTASDPHGDAIRLLAPSRFVSELGLEWAAAPEGPGAGRDPLTVAEAAAVWRRSLAQPDALTEVRLAALDGLQALGVDPAAWWFQRDWTDTGRPLHDHIRVSFSKLDKLENCALQFVLAEELGLEDRSGYHAWVGHLVHKLAEECDAGKIPREVDALVAEAERRWRPDQFPSLAVSEAFRRLVTETMLPAWLREYGQTQARATELPFEFEFDGVQVAGYIDRVGSVNRGGTLITDYKTGKSRNAGKAEDNLQLGIYYLAVNRTEALAPFRPVRAVELAFLRDRDRDTGSIERRSLGLTSKVQPQYEEQMASRLSGLIGELEGLYASERWRPSPTANCRYCPFKTLCPLYPEGAELFPGSEAVR